MFRLIDMKSIAENEIKLKDISGFRTTEVTDGFVNGASLKNEFSRSMILSESLESLKVGAERIILLSTAS